MNILKILNKINNFIRKEWGSILIVSVLIITLLVILLKKRKNESFTTSRLNRELVFFSMNGCGHCEDLKPVWDLLVNNHGDNQFVEIKKVIAQENPKIVEKYNIQAFPTILALKDGKLNHKYDGDRSYEDLVLFLDKAMRE